jgi:hypothetical protein
MLCHELKEVLAAEEPLSPAAVVHLDGCARCSALLADLKAIQSAAAELAEAEPPARLWVSLRNQLEAEGLIHEPEAEAVAATPRSSFWLSLRPALAGAYLALLVAVGGLFALRMGPVTPDTLGTSEIAGVSVTVPADLIPAAEPGADIRERNPEVTASYTRSLEIIDNFILLCEKTVREEPRNEMAREYLYDAYQQKAELLAMSMDRGAWGD